MPGIRQICRLLALATTLLAGAASGDALLDARVTRVIDGDSLRVGLGDGRAEEVRLYGMDAPEGRQAGGREASRALSTLVGGRAVQLIPVTRDRYGRLVAVLLVDGERVNERMIERGHAPGRPGQHETAGPMSRNFRRKPAGRPFPSDGPAAVVAARPKPRNPEPLLPRK